MAVPKVKTSQPGQRTPFNDFAPDADPTTDGAVQDAFGYHPIEKGFRTFPGRRTLGRGMPSTCVGAYTGTLIATPIYVAATYNALYQADRNGNLVLAQGGFSNTQYPWRFDAVGNDLLAVDSVDPPQYYRLSNGNWQPLPNGSVDNSPPPLASIVQVGDYNIIFVYPSSQTFLSTLSDTPSSWLGSVPNQVYIQPIEQTPGNITACRKLRDTVIFYKPSAFSIGYFLGGNTGWSLETVSGQIGVRNQECVINTGDYHYWFDGDFKFWSFDGYNLNELPNHLIEWFKRDRNPEYVSSMCGQYDSLRDLLIWAYSSNAANPGGALDTWLIHYRRKGTWSIQRIPIDLLLPNAYTDPINGLKYTGFLGRDHTTQVYDDAIAPQQAYLTSNYFGDYRNVFESSRVRPGFGPQAYPSAAVCQALNQYDPGKPAMLGAKEELSDDGWFNLINSSKLQAYQIITQGFCELIDIEPVLVFGGEV
jgi:hypothetical protein